MIELRVHGRGGQGGVIASKVMAVALFKENKYVQAFPFFGAERKGAPVVAFLRADEEPIRLRCNVYKPDYLIVLDATLLFSVDVTYGLKDGGMILVNTAEDINRFRLPDKFNVIKVDASGIAVKHKLGSVTSPIVNTAILGAFARITNLMSLQSLEEAVRETVPVKPDANVAAIRESYESAAHLVSA